MKIVGKTKQINDQKVFNAYATQRVPQFIHSATTEDINTETEPLTPQSHRNNFTKPKNQKQLSVTKSFYCKT